MRIVSYEFAFLHLSLAIDEQTIWFKGKHMETQYIIYIQGKGR